MGVGFSMVRMYATLNVPAASTPAAAVPTRTSGAGFDESPDAVATSSAAAKAAPAPGGRIATLTALVSPIGAVMWLTPRLHVP